MSEIDDLIFECELDAPPEKVWRALTVPEYLKRWLKPEAGTELAVVRAEENVSLTYRWRDGGQGAVAGVEDSIVTFELTATEGGGTWFRLTHAPMMVPVAANGNAPVSSLQMAA